MSESLPSWASPDIDLTKPSAARMYDYYLGGAHNFGIDRELAGQVLKLVPDLPGVVQANRAFLHRAVRYLTSQGIRQFIDIGSGIPTEGNTHETALQDAPDAKILYVDHDPVAVTHSELILEDVPNARVLRADLRHPESILNSVQRQELIDLDQPVAVLMVAVLHFIPETDEPEAAIRLLRDAVSSGSYLVISHSSDDARADEGEQVTELYRSAADPFIQRSRLRIGQFFQGYDLVDPGLVWLSQWRPDWPDQVGDNPSASAVACAVGRKP
jgi:hypothetical protein